MTGISYTGSVWRSIGKVQNMKTLILPLAVLLLASPAPPNAEEWTNNSGEEFPLGTHNSGVLVEDGMPRQVVSTAYTPRGALDKAADIDAYRRLWDWVRDEVGGIVPSPPPPVVVATPEVVHRIRNGPEPNGAIVLDTVAIYDRRGGQLILSAQPDLFDPESQSILIHELVHHAQSVAGRRFSCPAAAEEEAYQIQGQWLQRSGTNLEVAFGIDALTLKVITACGM